MSGEVEIREARESDLDAVHRGIPGLVVRERHARLAQVLVGHVGVEEP